MHIRNAGLRDIPAIIDLLKQVGQVHYEIRPDIFRSGAQKYDRYALAEIISDPTRPIFVAVEGSCVLGYCFCIHEDTQGNSVLTDRKELYIDDLCVDENRRGQGIAKALYAHTVAYARECGCHNLTLNVWEGNDNARRFYELAGMTPRKTYMEMKLC